MMRSIPSVYRLGSVRVAHRRVLLIARRDKHRREVPRKTNRKIEFLIPSERTRPIKSHVSLGLRSSARRDRASVSRRSCLPSAFWPHCWSDCARLNAEVDVLS